jgi:TPR repeat protein
MMAVNVFMTNVHAQTIQQNSPSTAVPPVSTTAPAASIEGDVLSPTIADLAFGAYQRGQFVTALKLALERLKQDPKDAAMMTLLGVLSEQGASVPRDPVKAAGWYRLAHDNGDVNGTFAYAMALLKGDGVPKDQTLGMTLLKTATDLSHPYAAYNLALLLLHSAKEGEQTRAAVLMRRAALHEIPEAQYMLALILREGKGVPVQPSEAAQWMQRAAQNGDTQAQTEWGIMLFNGDNVPKDEVNAVRFFRRAAWRGNVVAQNRLARLLIAGRGTPRNIIDAAAWHLLASSQGRSDAMLDDELKALSAEERERAEKRVEELVRQ